MRFKQTTTIFLLSLLITGLVINLGMSEESQEENMLTYEELLEFFRHLLTTPQGQSQPPEIFPGEFPSDMPVEIPSPEAARIMGSVLHSADPFRSTTVLDLPWPPEDILAYYEKRLLEEGWEKWKSPSESEGGFVPPISRYSETFCLENEKIYHLQVFAFKTEDGSTIARLTFAGKLEARSCKRREPWPGKIRYLPTLEVPQKAVWKGGGRGEGTDEISSRITFILDDTDPKILEKHFRDQLLEAGWSLKGLGKDGIFAWSTWSFKDPQGNTWSALLLVTDLSKDLWSAHLQAFNPYSS